MIPLLIKLPFISKALSFVKAKTRLAIEYLLLALLIAVAAIAFTMWLHKVKTDLALSKTQTELVSVKSRLGDVERTNQMQQETIESLRDMRKRDAEALTGLFQDYKNLSGNHSAVRAKLRELEIKHENVRFYLNSDIPPELKCLLNKTCSPNSDGNKAGKGSAPKATPATVRTAPAKRTQ